jgi:hypothetical protein
MANIIPAPSAAIERQNRYAGRLLSRLDTQTDIEVAKIDQAAELQATRSSAVGYVAKRAMHEVAMLSQMEAQLSMLVPMAVSRLQAIGDIAAMEQAEVVSQTVRRVSR